MTILIADERNVTQTLNDHLVVEQTGVIRAGPTAIFSGGSFTIRIHGSVYGPGNAITAGDFTQLRIGSTGLVYGESDVVSVGSNSVVSNDGTITTPNGYYGTGILALGVQHTITNTGYIEGYYGIRAGQGSQSETIVNAGRILSSGGIGIETSGAASITNSGYIQSFGGIGIRLRDTPSLRNNWITNTGTIQAATAIKGSDRIDVIINTGHIIGTIDLGGGNDRYEGRNGRTESLILLGDGNDTVYGGVLSETITGGAGDDLLDGGAGDADAAQFLGSANFTVDLRTSNPQQTGDGLDTLIGIEFVFTEAGADRLIGNDAANGFHAGGGADVIDGGLGNDTLWGGEGIDTLVFSGSRAATVDLAVVLTAQNTGYGLDVLNGIENLGGGSGADRLTGDGLANVMSGNGGKDRLSGRDGNDTLNGGAANDTLTGGGGQDVFVFDTSRSQNIDTIRDYSVADDTIQLQNSIYTKLGAAGRLASKAFWTGKQAHDSSDRVIYDKGTGALYYDADGTGSAKQVKIGQLSKGLKMSAAEFFVI